MIMNFLHSMSDKIYGLRMKIDALEAENKELKEALQKIASTRLEFKEGWSDLMIVTLAAIAKKALDRDSLEAIRSARTAMEKEK